jgi:hypothetical protein
VLVDINPELYGPAVMLENRKKVLYVKVLKAIYGMLEAALFWYKTFRKDLEDIWFIFNPYNPCVANKKVQGSQQTILFHVDDLKSSHKMKSENDRFEKWLNSKYGNHGKVTATRGKVHDYLGMELDYRKRGELKINMTKYVENMINDFPVKLGKKDVTKTPVADSLFNLGTGAKLDTKRSVRSSTHLWQKDYSYVNRQGPIFSKPSRYCVRESRIRIKQIGRKADERYAVFEWHQEWIPHPERRWPKSGQMVRGRIIRGASRL